MCQCQGRETGSGDGGAGGLEGEGEGDGEGEGTDTLSCMYGTKDGNSETAGRPGEGRRGREGLNCLARDCQPALTGLGPGPRKV